MNKNYFNDSRPWVNVWEMECCSCRCDFFIKVFNYPHGPNEVQYCPICGSKFEGDAPSFRPKTKE